MVRSIPLLTVMLMLGCATQTPGNEPRVLPTFREVPKRPDFAVSKVARRAWRLFQLTAVRQIAFESLSERSFAGISGVVVVERGDGFLARFAEQVNGKPASRYDVLVPKGASPRPSVTQHQPPILLTASEATQWRAQAMLLQELSTLDTCSSINLALAIPDDESTGWLSYLIPMPEVPGRMELGGYYRFKLDPFALQVLQREQLYPGCSAWDLPNDIVGFAIAQPKHRRPVESDVFASLFWNLPLFVGNAENDTVYAVDDAGVTDVTESFRQ